VGLLVTLALSLFSTVQFQRAQASQQALLRENGQLLAHALAGASSASAATGNLDQAMLLAVEASRREDTYTTRDALFGALESNTYLDAVLQGGRDAAHPQEVGQKVGFSADGQTLMSFTLQQSAFTGQVTLWNVATKQPRNKFTAHCPTGASSGGEELGYAALSPNGQLVATSIFACTQPGIEIWDATTGAHVAHLALAYPLINSNTDAIAFSSDGRLVAATACLTASCPEGLDIWNVATARVVQQLPQLPGLGGFSIGLAFSPDGHMLAESSDDWVVIWNLASRFATTVFTTGSVPAPGVHPSFPVNYSANVATFSPDGRTLAIGGSFWQLLSSGGRSTTEGFLLVESATAPDNYAWNIQNAGSIADLAFSPDGRTILTSAGNDLQIWDTSPVTPIAAPLTGHTDAVASVSFSADGRHLASTGLDDQVLLWRLTPGSPFTLLPGGDVSGVSPAVFSPDGKELATYALEQRTVALWDVASGREVARITDVPPAQGDLGALAYSPDGRYLALAFTDGEVLLLDAARHTSAGLEFVAPSGGLLISSLAFSPNGQFLGEVLRDYIYSQSPAGVGSGVPTSLAVVWNVATRQPLSFAEDSSLENASALAFSTTSQVVAITTHGDPTHTIRLWDLSSGQSVGALTGDAAEVESLAFSPDGRSLAALDSAGTVTL
jgi:WD40 repeat protein